MADHRASYRQIAAVAIALLLGLAGPIFGQTTLQTTPDAGASIRSLAQPDPHLYRSEEAGSPIENLGTLFTRKIVPALPGAGLLLLLSTMFSSINFYSEVRGEQRSLARTWKYLLFWVTVNYTFSLILLFLILPEKLSLANVTNQLFTYCVAVTALPELSANVRLQLGKSAGRTLDLYKYKNKVSEFIAEQMKLASVRERARDQECLESSYAEAIPMLQARLIAFVHEGDFPPSDQGVLIDKIHAAREFSANALIELVASRQQAGRRLLDFFKDDIERFRASPAARLMTDLQPQITLSQARALVRCGITSRTAFAFRTLFEFQRRRLAARLGWSQDDINELYFSTMRARRRQQLARLRTMAAVAAVLLVIVGILMHSSVRIPTYTPAREFIKPSTSNRARVGSDHSGRLMRRRSRRENTNR